MSNVRWSVVVPEETDRALHSFLAQRGTKKGDISRFVEEAVQSRLFELTVEGVKEPNRPRDPKECLPLPYCRISFNSHCSLNQVEASRAPPGPGSVCTFNNQLVTSTPASNTWELRRT